MKERGSFGSKFGIVAAAAGSAIGLGNIWRFPYIVGENGGGAFLLIYIAIVLIIGVPMMLSELVIGRSSQKNVFGAFRKLKPGSAWSWVGILGVATPFVIFIFYSVVAGWSLEFLQDSLLNNFKGRSSEEIKTGFDLFIASGWKPVVWTIVFIAAVEAIVMAGVEKGIERYSKILMPLMVLILLTMGIYSMTLSGFKEGMAFLFKPDFSKIDGHVILEALGQAFFSLSLGMGVMVTYGSYIKKEDNMVTTTRAVVLSDTLIALLAGVAIFPAVFTFGISPTSGPDLVFITLPSIFQQMAGGYFLSLFFFVLLLMAALTSSVSLLEVLVAYLMEELKMKRKNATILISSALIVLGTLCAVSQMPGSSLKIGGNNIFDFLDNLSATYMLPIGAFFIIVFVGWVFGNKRFKSEVTGDGKFNNRLYPIVFFIVRFIAPVVIAVIFLTKAGILNL